MKHNKLYLALLFLVLTFEAVFTGLLPVSRGHLFSLLSARQEDGIYLALLYYFLNYLAIDGAGCFKGYVVLKVSLWYRKLRTYAVKDKLFGDLADAIMGEVTMPSLPSNSPQRIQEDIKLSYVSRITVWSEYYVSGLILVQLFILNLDEPKLILGAMLYAIISVGIAVRFNPRLTRAELMVQSAEADYRSSLVECIVNITGLGDANKASLKAARIRMEYLLFTKLQLGLVAVLPYFLLIPKLLAGSIDLGLLVQHAATFGLIVVNAAIIIQMYVEYIKGTASEKRIQELE